MHPYYLALQQLLEKAESEASAATVHGIWCGRLAAGDTFDTQEWWAFTMRVIGQEASVEENMSAAFKAVANFADQNLQRDSFEFQPWLPADTADCSSRIAALADWCQGFIEGLISVLGKQLASASEATKEVVKDLLDIGEVDTDVSGSEEDEKQLYELTEYVKVAVLNIWHDYALKIDTDSAKQPTLH